MPTPGTLSITGELATIEAARSKWLDEAGPEERERIVTLLRKHNLSELSGINALCADVVVEVMTGGISASLAAGAKPFLDILNANIWQMAAQAGQRDLAPVAVAEALLEIRSRTRVVQATYSMAQPPALAECMPDPDVVEAGELVPARTTG